MKSLNIWSVVALTSIVCALSIFTTLFFVKRNIVQQETIAASIVSQVPEKVEVKFVPTKPDCTFSSDKLGRSLLASRKTFRKALLSKEHEQLFKITSEVTAYATVPVDFIENNITVNTNKENLQRAITNSLPKQKSKFFKGFLWGVGTGTLVISTICILSK